MIPKTGSELTVNEATVLWAEKVIDIWTDRIVQLKVNNAWIHAESFAHHVYTSSGGNISKIVFVYEYFLRFTDMGVGRGVTMESRAFLDTKRKQKLWFTKTFYREVSILARILAKRYAVYSQIILTSAGQSSQIQKKTRIIDGL